MSDTTAQERKNSVTYNVSTDLAGASVMRADELVAAYASAEDLIKQENPDFIFSYEVIAWLTAIQTMFASIHKSGRLVGGVHGRIGAPNMDRPAVEHLRHVALNSALAPAETALSLAIKNSAEYLVVHDNELNNKTPLQTIREYLRNVADPSTNPVIMIENSPYSKSIAKTEKIIHSLQDHGQSVGFMFDGLHALKEITDNPYTLTDQELNRALFFILEIIDRLLSIFAVVGIHFPAGDNFDSMPMEKIRPNFWPAFRQVLEGRSSLRFFTIENQQRGTEIMLAEQKIPAIAERNKRVLTPAIEAGLFSLSPRAVAEFVAADLLDT